MIRFLSVLLLFVFFVQTTLGVGYAIYWKVNQNKIAAAYCVNKAKPQMQCNGKCHLNKTLKKLSVQENRKGSEKSFQLIDTFQPYYFEEHALVLNPNIRMIESCIYYHHIYNFNNTSTFFHPPKY